MSTEPNKSVHKFRDGAIKVTVCWESALVKLHRELKDEDDAGSRS